MILGRSALWALAALLAWVPCAVSAQSQGTAPVPTPVHAQGLVEELLSVSLSPLATQSGVLSRSTTAVAPRRLAVLLPGHPSVVRPEVEDGVMKRSALTGNFLIRARRHLADEDIALLLVDCRSDQGALCSAQYQASSQRQKDVQLLVDQARRRLPSIEEVWLVGTSMGTISSTHMAQHDPKAYRGAIHTASITEPLAAGSYRIMAQLDLRNSPVRHVLVHHQDDPCSLTTHAGAVRWSRAFGIPLLTVRGGGGFEGPPCMAHTEHGFKGREREVMRAIAAIIRGAPAVSSEL